MTERVTVVLRPDRVRRVPYKLARWAWHVSSWTAQLADWLDKAAEEPLYHLCAICGTVSRERRWTFWQQNPDEATEAEMPWVPSLPGQTDPMALCPVCKWEHRDTDDGSGFYVGTRAEMEAQRAKDVAEFGPWWELHG